MGWSYVVDGYVVSAARWRVGGTCNADFSLLQTQCVPATEYVWYEAWGGKEVSDHLPIGLQCGVVAKHGRGCQGQIA